MVLLKGMPLLIFFVIFLIIQGCAGMKRLATPGATIGGVSDHFRVGQILDLKTGKALTFDQLIDEIASKDMIFVGEVHDNPEHHLIQVQILQALGNRSRTLTVAMEFFQKPQQPSIDRYLDGELSESEFLQEVDWKTGWGLDYHFYRPLMLSAKQNGFRVLAINAPREIVRKVARRGLKSLEDGERNMLAKEIDLGDEAHREFVRRAYEQHSHSGLKKFEFFYEAQCVWEDTMAHNLAEYWSKTKNKLIVFTGNGHIVNKFGVPNRIRKRFPVSIVTIYPYPLDKKVDLGKETADYVWLTAVYPHNRLGFER